MRPENPQPKLVDYKELRELMMLSAVPGDNLIGVAVTCVGVPVLVEGAARLHTLGKVAAKK